jgi:serine/threonine protein kinase
MRRIGSIAEEFVVEALLGKGSYGSAYRARRLRDGVVCAVKRVCMEGMSADDLRETLNEVKVLQSLHHPFVIEMQSCFLTSKHLNIVMPLADCGDLSSYIKNQKGSALPEADVLVLFTQICCALKHVHDRKILHRDIKSANILLCTGLRGALEAKLADFGIARVLHGTMELASTAVGTPYYMSPELCKNESYDAKSDIWALGCLLYEMCTQKNPFTGVNFSGLALKILRGKYPPLPSSYSRNMSTLVSMMLEVDAHKRPSVSQILKLPFIASVLPRVLDKDTLRREFSHTVLHGFCADDLKCAMQAVAADPRYESQFQPARAQAAAPQVHVEQGKPRSLVRAGEHTYSAVAAAHPDKNNSDPAPSFREQHADACQAKPVQPNAFNPALHLQNFAIQQPPPSRSVKPSPGPPHPIGRVTGGDVSANPSMCPEAHKEPPAASAAHVLLQAPALQQPNEPNPPSAAFVIVHVETPMHLSKKGAEAEPLANIYSPDNDGIKKPSLGCTARPSFTMLGSSLQLEHKTSSFEASASLRVEMLRVYLEKNLGVEVFCK